MAALSQAELYASFGSSPRGLEKEEARERLIHHGRNAISAPPSRSYLRTFLDQFANFFALLLWAAAAICFVGNIFDPESGMLPIGWAIIAVIVLNGMFGFYQEYRTEKSLESLRGILPLRVRVRRGGEENVVLAEELVPGDIVILEEGDKVPADLYVILAFDLWVNESTLSGESEPLSADTVESGHVKSILYSGTYVVRGEAEGLVFATGKESRYGTIAMLAQQVEPGIGHLQQEIKRISKTVAAVSFLIAASFIVMAGAGGFELWKTFLFALGVLVAMIPEGLLPTVTLALAFASQRMAAKGFLVNSLSVIENLGAVTVIATDKTGTITRNTMEVIAWEQKGGGDPTAALVEGAMLCNRAEGEIGDPVEVALLAFAGKYGREESIRRALPLVREYTFDYHLKRMSTVHAAGEGFVLYCKGAPEVIQGLCDRLETPTGEVVMDEEAHRDLADRHERLAAAGYRVIAFASKRLSSLPDSRGDAERRLVFNGFVAMVDPLREEVVDAVAVCRKAGIRIVMLTGDHPLTAGWIGVSAGIIASPSEVTSGERLESLPSSARKRLLRHNHVFARVSPEQKLHLVTLLKEMGETVAVTGDGVNDAPALKKADVGIAMGSGTEVAKDSADVVLVDDHFATIVRGIEEGRAVYENIRRFITYMLASNLPEALPYVLFFWTGMPLALPVALVLAIDLGTDIVPGLALGAEMPHKGVMDKRPRGRREPILTPGVYLRAFGFLGLLSAMLSIGFFWFYLRSHGWQGEALSWDDPLYLEATTLAFAVIVFAQIANGLSCRSERESIWSIGWSSNPYFVWGMAVELAILLSLVFVPFLSTLFGTSPFDAIYWLGVCGVTLIVFSVEEGRKWIVRHLHRRRQ